MPSYSMEDLIKEAGKDTTVTLPSMQKIGRGGKKAVGQKGYQEHRSREDTETLIKNYLAETNRPMTIIAVARYLERTASPHFRSIVLQMRDAGHLVETVDIAPNGRTVRYLYSLKK